MELGQNNPVKAEISKFKNFSERTPSEKTSILEFALYVRHAKYHKAIEQIRNCIADGDEKQADKLKKSLPAVCISGVVTEGGRASAFDQGRFRHSGFLQGDFDAKDIVPRSANEVRAMLSGDEHVQAVFLSPKDGVKAIIRIPVCNTPAEHKAAYHAAESYFREKYGLNLDPSTKDPVRLCFASYDPDAYVKSSPATILPVAAEENAVGKSEKPTGIAPSGYRDANAKHDASFSRPGICAATLAKLDIRHIDASEAFELLGQKFAGIYIPYGIHVEGKPFGRLRLDKPESDRKYTQRVGSGVHPYFPLMPGLEVQPDLVIVEGEFKAIALCEAGVRAIGISGFYGFQQEGEMCPRLAKHLKEHPPRRILFLGDNDTALNYQFADAAVKLAAMAGVPVLLPRIPMSMPKGSDDCREQLGAEAFTAWWQGLVENAVPLPPKLQPDMLAVELFKRAVPALKEISGVERALMMQKLGRLASCLQPLARGELAGLCKAKLGINKSVLHQAASNALQKDSAPQAIKDEWSTVVEICGDPCFMNDKGKVTGLNDRFWAGLIREQHRLLHEPDEKRFYRYDETMGLWRVQSHALLEQLACDTLNAEMNGSSDYLKHAPLAFARSVVGHLEGLTERRGAFDGAPTGIHVANGYLMLDPDSIELHDFSPEHYSRNQSPIAFDPDAQCPIFLEQLLAPVLDADDIALLRYYVGQCLLGRNLTQTILLLHGPGGAGKGVVSNIVQWIIGELNCYELRTDHLDERFEIFRYIGKTLLYGADVEPDFLRTDAAHMLKKLVGDDLISPEGKNSNAVFMIRGNFNMMITCNKRLSVRLAGDVSAWRRRLRILLFKAPATGRPVIAKFDKKLIESEGAGILNWALDGAAQVLADQRAQRERPLSPAQHQRLEALLGQSDSLRHFLESRVENQPGEALEKNDLLEAYADFCGEQGWEPLSELAARKELNNRMLELFGSVERKSVGPNRNQRGYSNVAFQPEIVP